MQRSKDLGILTGCDFVVALALELKALLLVSSLTSVELSVKKIDLALTHVLLVSLRVVLLFGDLTLNVFKFALALLDRSIKLHSLLSSVLQVLLKIGNLT